MIWSNDGSVRTNSQKRIKIPVKKNRAGIMGFCVRQIDAKRWPQVIRRSVETSLKSHNTTNIQFDNCDLLWSLGCPSSFVWVCIVDVWRPRQLNALAAIKHEWQFNSNRVIRRRVRIATAFSGGATLPNDGGVCLTRRVIDQLDWMKIIGTAQTDTSIT